MAKIVPGTGGMTQAQYDAEVKRKQQAGIALTGAVDMNTYKPQGNKPQGNKPQGNKPQGSSNTSGKGGNGGMANNNSSMQQAIANKVNGTPGMTPNQNKPYETSEKNKTMYGNNTSTHIKKQAGDKGWVSDQYGKDDKGTYVLKQGNAGNKVYMNDSNKQYFADNYGGTGGFNYDEANKVTYKGDTESMRTDSKYDIYGDVGTNSAEKQALKDAERDKFLGMSAEELADYKANSTSQLEQNFISTLDGTFKNNEAMKDMSPIAIAPEKVQGALADLVYNQMGQMNGVGKYEGLSTKDLDQFINQAGLGGMVDVNAINKPFLEEQMMKYQAEQAGGEAKYVMDANALMQDIVSNGGLKEGYTYNAETGEITPEKGYIQYGGILMDEGEASRWGNNIPGLMEQTVRQENVDKQMYETPLEMRARYEPDSMTDEMKADLEMERGIKAELEQLTLQLEQLELQGGQVVPMVLGSGIGSGGMGGGMGNNTTGNGTNGSGMYGSGGNSEFQGVKGGGRSAVYGTSQNYTNADQSLLNAMARRRG